MTSTVYRATSPAIAAALGRPRARRWHAHPVGPEARYARSARRPIQWESIASTVLLGIAVAAVFAALPWIGLVAGAVLGIDMRGGLPT